MTLPRALRAWLDAAARTGDPVAAARAAAEALAADPWAVVTVAGHLARAELATAPVDLGLDARLRPCGPDKARAVVVVPAGAPFPETDRGGRKDRGAFDTPVGLARHAVRRAGAAADPLRRALDPACGTGAFLVALAEAGVPEIYGVELDPAAAAVAEVACPRARVRVGDGLLPAPEAPVDLVIGNPPFVPPERQTRAQRDAMEARFPWLSGRYDLAVPFAEAAMLSLRPGGALGLLLPTPLLTQAYARPLRERWTAQHRLLGLDGPFRFPGAAIQVSLVVATSGGGPGDLPDHGLSARAWAGLPGLPWDAALRPGDPELVARVGEASVPLGDLAEIDTGVVSHSPGKGKAHLLFDTPGRDRVPYVDAADLASGRRRWLRYAPDAMHRAKHPGLFASPKILVQRLRGDRPVRAWIDHEGLYAGHTLTVIRPTDPRVPIEALHALICSPLAAGLARITWGPRLDLYPRDLRAWPVPRRWLEAPALPLEVAWDLSPAEIRRLHALAGPIPAAHLAAPIAPTGLDR